MLGLKRGCVELHPHDQNWGIEAAKTIALKAARELTELVAKFVSAN